MYIVALGLRVLVFRCFGLLVVFWVVFICVLTFVFQPTANDYPDWYRCYNPE